MRETVDGGGVGHLVTQHRGWCCEGAQGQCRQVHKEVVQGRYRRGFHRWLHSAVMFSNPPLPPLPA